VRQAKMWQRLDGLLVMVENGSAYTAVESSRVPPVLQIKCLDTACFIFVNWTPVMGRDVCYFELGNECRKIGSFSSGPPCKIRCLSL